MSSKGIEFLLQKADEVVTENHVVDFLNTHFSSAIKAETLTMLNNSLGYLKVTESQLENLQAIHLELEDALTEHQISIRLKNHGNESIESEVISNKQLVSNLIILQKNVKNLLQAKQYLNILVIADELSTKAKQLVEKSSQKALVPYTQLTHIARKIQSDSDYQILKNLDGFIRKNLDALWEDMKSKLSKKFQHILDSLGWPTPLKVLLPNELQEKKTAFTRAFCKLLLLQNPTGIEDSDKIVTNKLILLTNQIDKLEWYFTHILTAIHDHSSFLTEEVQVIIDEAGFNKYNVK
ncbi:3349_t:CDS:2, partial [Ambispora leptoticha]